MRFFPIFALLSFLWSLVRATKAVPNSEVYIVDLVKSDLEPMSPNFSRLYNVLMQHYEPENDGLHLDYDVTKRNLLEDTLLQILGSLNRSGVIVDVLHEIADSPEQMNTLSNYIFQFLLGMKTTDLGGLNILSNASELFHTVNESGLVESTLLALLLDDAQRHILADNLGEVLVNYTWIGLLFKRIGDNGKLSFKIIFDTLQDYLCKDPGFNGTSYMKMRRRDDSSKYSGLLQALLNNLAGSALHSQLASTSLSSILAAVNGSGIVVPTVQTILGDQKILQMVGFISNKLYNFGVFDAIPLDKYFALAKQKRLLSDGFQFVLTHPKWSSPIGMIFHRLQSSGVFEQIRRNLYGP